MHYSMFIISSPLKINSSPFERSTLKVQNYVLSSLYGFVVVLIMLDLSAVLDTIDHALLSRLHYVYGIHNQTFV